MRTRAFPALPVSPLLLIWVVCACVLLAACVPTEGRAQQQTDYGLSYHGWGVRAGVSIDPDQFFFGGHLDLGQFAPLWHFIPSMDIGFGDHWKVLSLNPDVMYYFPVEDIGNLYAGAGLPIQWWKVEGLRNTDSEAKVGLHGLAGLVLQEVPIFFELNLGIIETPDLKMTVGYTFLQ